MSQECPNCGSTENVTSDVLVNNSKQIDSSKGIDETDIDFRVEFNGDDVVTVTLCDDCYANNRYLDS